jgi:hypothetical protein
VSASRADLISLANRTLFFNLSMNSFADIIAISHSLCDSNCVVIVIQDRSGARVDDQGMQLYGRELSRTARAHVAKSRLWRLVDAMRIEQCPAHV